MFRDDMSDEIWALTRTNEQLKAENARLQAENNGLNERVTRLENAIRWLHKEHEHYCLGEHCEGLIGKAKL